MSELLYTSLFINYILAFLCIKFYFDREDIKILYNINKTTFEIIDESKIAIRNLKKII